MMNTKMVYGITSSLNLRCLELFALFVSYLAIYSRKLKQQGLNLLFYRVKVSIKLSMLKTICCDTLQRYKSITVQDIDINNQGKIPTHIYVLWLQGIDQAPEIVKTCIMQLQLLDNYTIEILDQDTINSLSLSPIFFEKYQKGLISRTHLSDIVRLFLLSRKGGIWCDSTLLVYGFPKEMSEKSFYTVRRFIKEHKEKYNPAIVETKDGSLAPWTAYFIASSANNIVTSFAYDMLVEYYTKRNEQMDYFLIDMVFRLGYDRIPLVREQIDAISINNNGHIHDLFPRLNDHFDHEVWNVLCAGSTANMFKLSWKQFKPIGKDTFWEVIKNNILNDGEDSYNCHSDL